MTPGSSDTQPCAPVIVVASFSGESSLTRCLRSLERGASKAKVVVASNLPKTAIQHLESLFPEVQFALADTEANVFQLRTCGLELSSGDPVILLEDHCEVGEGWLNALLTELSLGHSAVSGPIENGNTRSAFDWALYFCEYSAYMPPMSEGMTGTLLAANTAYSRLALWSCYTVWQKGYHDNEVHDALKSTGGSFSITNKAMVYCHLSMRFRGAMGHLYYGGRRFGGYRKSGASNVARVFWIFAAPLVPIVLLARIVSLVWRRRPQLRVTLLRGLPWILCFVMAWSFGEIVSYIGPAPKR